MEHRLDHEAAAEHRLDHEGAEEHRVGARTLKEMLADKRNMILLVATLIATITFQAAMNPPGGVWQDDSPQNFPNPHKAGDSVMAYNHPHSYATFYIAVLIGFIASLSTIFLVMTALRSDNKSVSGVLIIGLIVVMCLTFISVVVIVAVSIDAITPDTVRKEIDSQTGIAVGIIAYCVLLIPGITSLVAICFLIPSGADDENHANGDVELAPQNQVDHVHHANDDEEAPQNQVDHLHHAANGDQEAPQNQVDHVHGANDDEEAPEIQEVPLLFISIE